LGRVEVPLDKDAIALIFVVDAVVHLTVEALVIVGD
jgi:hypothetical protein